ncbi:hypothetical protein AB205_0092370 [Aquarana catesbeiana]|uniref:Myb/SANT-like DNA-binding domain-containing protein n=1 Tax=Aquarana catesbeiana TaxID=8400 RepID=A0A2G9QC18_AQUCT|nr:hypothetical protein AB205_0092370 [Aquarana catesbeiana]
MAERQQVHDNLSNKEDESPEPQMSRSRRRFKASNMSFVEMVEMVDILKRANYDVKYGPYSNPNVRKAKIMTKVVKSLQKNFGVRRSKEQLRKRWSDLKLREQDQYRRIKRELQKSDAVDVVEEETHFTSASAHILIGEIIVCNRELEKIKENINDIEKRLNNITDVFKQNIKHPNIFTFCHYIFYFQKVLK